MTIDKLLPLLRARFEAGSSLTDEHLSRFHTFVAPVAGESRQQYAERLEEMGYCRVTTSERMTDIGAYRNLMADAEVQGVPIVVMTGHLADNQQDMTPMKTLDQVMDRTTGKMKIDTSRIADLSAPEVVPEPKWNNVERRAPITSEGA
jgi:hypothetical protein